MIYNWSLISGPKTRMQKILLVDDNEIDAEVVLRGLRKHNITNEVVHHTGGQAALDYLHEQAATNPLPVILLDLNMPGMDGLEFLEAVRSDPALRPALVFVLTDSHDETDRERAFGMNVAGYILKSNAGADFIRVIALLQHYWNVVELPDGPALELKA